jgi:tetratricopeptide (TPR) repeat protein
MKISHEFPRKNILGIPVIQVMVIGLLGCLAYSNTFHAAFVFDDQPQIMENPVIRNLGHFFRDSAGYDYNPRRFIGYLTFALNYHLDDLNVAGFHFFNLAVHIINSLLVYFFVVLTFKTPFLRGSILASFSHRIALFAALLFEVHPLQTQAVTYVVQRFTSLMTTFFLASIVFYAMWRFSRENGHPRKKYAIGFYILSVISAVLAMKTKENAFTLPIAIVLYDLFFFGWTKRAKPLYLVPILLTLTIIPLSLLNVHQPVGDLIGDVSKMTMHKPTVSRLEYLMTQFSVIGTYIRLLFLPIHQNLDYDYPINYSLLTARAVGSVLFLFVLWMTAVLLYRASRKGSDSGLSLISFGIFWFFLTIAVESSVIPITDVIYEHRVYLPSVGAVLSFSTLFYMISNRYLKNHRGRTPVLLAAMVIILLASATYCRNKVWADPVTLWQDVVIKSPGKARGYNNLGAALSDAGRKDEAVAVLKKAISINPDHAEAYYNIGRIYLVSSEQTDEAIRMLRRAIEIAPDYPDAYVNLAAAYLRARRFREAAELMEMVIQRYGDRADARFNLGVANVFLGRREYAIRQHEVLRRMDPVLAAELDRLIFAQESRK